MLRVAPAGGGARLAAAASRCAGPTRLNAELAGRVEALERTNAEVRTLNEELRHQVGNRSRELAETLANVGSAAPAGAGARSRATRWSGRYKRACGFVGSGGMAWVYEVERETDGKRLALKLLHGRRAARRCRGSRARRGSPRR